MNEKDVQSGSKLNKKMMIDLINSYDDDDDSIEIRIGNTPSKNDEQITKTASRSKMLP